jgi:hypothetical protein
MNPLRNEVLIQALKEWMQIKIWKLYRLLHCNQATLWWYGGGISTKNRFLPRLSIRVSKCPRIYGLTLHIFRV